MEVLRIHCESDIFKEKQAVKCILSKSPKCLVAYVIIHQYTIIDN